MRTGGCRSLVLAIVWSLAACTPAPPTGGSPATSIGPGHLPGSSLVTPSGERLRFVALGDSYTIGTSVSEAERWPNQLVALERRLELVANLAVNGFTSRDVIEVELPRLGMLQPELITLLIGVNDVVQGVPAATYRESVARILGEAARGVGAGRVLVVTTPDYTVTPRGAEYGDPARQGAAIRQYNAIITEVAGGLGIAVVDIHDISLEAASDRSLVAADGLHPSGAQYARWVERIAPAVTTLLDG